MTTYTAALLTATSTPLWAAAPRLLAIRFASSAMATGAAAVAILAVWSDGRVMLASSLRNIVVVALIVEFSTGVMSQPVYRDRGVDYPLRANPWGPVHQVGVQLAGTMLPIVLYVLAGVDPASALDATVAASLCVFGGGLLMRGSVMLAGNLSARRPEDYFHFASPAREQTGDDLGSKLIRSFKTAARRYWRYWISSVGTCSPGPASALRRSLPGSSTCATG
jgi:hypothetical protein